MVDPITPVTNQFMMLFLHLHYIKPEWVENHSVSNPLHLYRSNMPPYPLRLSLLYQICIMSYKGTICSIQIYLTYFVCPIGNSHCSTFCRYSLGTYTFGSYLLFSLSDFINISASVSSLKQTAS